MADLTTLRLGGPAAALVPVVDDESAIAALTEDALVVGGGSNLVVADAGLERTVVLMRTRGIDFREVADGVVDLVAAAGEVWDDVVRASVGFGHSGIEALSGIPGCVGATPVQNVGAYGQEVSQTILSVDAYDRVEGRRCELTPEDCDFGYRDSRFKREPGRFVVLNVHFRLQSDGRSAPVGYAELARALDVEVGERAPVADVRDAVLALRRGKGMVLDAEDLDSRSAGSFFTNPILSARDHAALLARAEQQPPSWPEPGGRVKVSAAWLIQHAGFEKGQGDPEGIAISSKHVLALTNRGAGTTVALVRLAHEIADGVFDRFGVDLVPEPVFAGVLWR